MSSLNSHGRREFLSSFGAASAAAFTGRWSIPMDGTARWGSARSRHIPRSPDLSTCSRTD